MRAPTSVLSYAPLGLLALLSAGAIVLSLLMAPPLAQQQLQGAASSTVAASSFALTYRTTVEVPGQSAASGGRTVATNSSRFEYQAPDRVLEETHEPTGLSVSILLIDGDRYERTGNGPWSELPPVSQSGSPGGAEVAGEVLDLLRPLAGATSVVRSGSTYRFALGNPDTLLSTLFGQAAQQLSSVELSAVVKGDFVSDEHIVATQASEHITIDFGFASIGELPPIRAPHVSQPR
ncbi:MAG: hypothetical protein ABSC00_01940 [Acidimicrobiales bacterium]|jgi:hypothetical protein